MSKLHSKLLSITQKSWELFERMFARSLALALLTGIGLAVVDLLVDSGMTNRYAIIHRFPEFIPLMLAAVKLTFIEMSVFWVRFATQPSIDVQQPVREVQKQAWDNTIALALTHGINSLVWMFRVVVLIYLAQ
jgi:hypothetical protein